MPQTLSYKRVHNNASLLACLLICVSTQAILQVLQVTSLSLFLFTGANLDCNLTQSQTVYMYALTDLYINKKKIIKGSTSMFVASIVFALCLRALQPFIVLYLLIAFFFLIIFGPGCFTICCKFCRNLFLQSSTDSSVVWDMSLV